MNTPQQKLKNIPSLYFINLDRQPLRRATFEEQCKIFEIVNYTRIEAFDGTQIDLRQYLVGNYPKEMSVPEVGCVLSHLKSIRHFVEKTTHPYILIAEDDLSLEMVAYWQFNWDFFQENLPYDWDIVQLVVNNKSCIHLNLHIRFVNDFSSACYLISRRYAEKLISLHCVGDLYKIDQYVKPRGVADELLYNAGRAYSLPLFTTHLSSEGAINSENYWIQEHSNKIVSDFWKAYSYDKNPDNSFLFDYNPFVGQLPPEIYNQPPRS